MSKLFRPILPRLAVAVLVAAGYASAQTRDNRDQRRTPIVAAVEKTGPAVVNISAEQVIRQRASAIDSFFFGSDSRRERRYTTEALGSGVILDAAKGIVVTNDHVVSGASRIIVTLSDGRELEAKVRGADADNDLAVLEIL